MLGSQGKTHIAIDWLILDIYLLHNHYKWLIPKNLHIFRFDMINIVIDELILDI